MFRNEIFDKYTFNAEKLCAYGFARENGAYVLKRVLGFDNLQAEVKISGGSFAINVYDADGEEYLLFNIKDSEGGYVSSVREYAGLLVNDILQRCFDSINLRDKLLAHLREKYGTVPETPWADEPEYMTLKTAGKKKWYGLFMNIPYKYLGLPEEGRIDVLNLRNTAEKVPQLIDGRHYFPAWHMNKKYWLTVLLDAEADIERIKALLDESYEIIENKK